MRRWLSLLLIALALTACTTAVPDDGTMRYARWLTVTDSVASVLNPWREGEVLHRYRLPSTAEEAYRRAVSATSLHAYLAYRLGVMDRIAGVMDADYIVAPELREALPASTLSEASASAPLVPCDASQGSPAPVLLDFGSSQSPNLERIKTAGCDLIFASPFENAGYGSLESLGIPIVECADYMEDTPLGRAEWMRFYGRLLGCGERADSLFAAEESVYQALCTPNQTAAAPTVLLGKRGGQAWYVPGGMSYLGRLLDDADTHYVFAEEASTGSVPLDFETVYASAKDADLWLITYAAPPAADGTFSPLTYAALAAEDERYTQFRPFRDRHIWACNTLEVPYYDALPWEPSALLRDVILIAHPERFPGEKPNFFRPLQ